MASERVHRFEELQTRGFIDVNFEDSAFVTFWWRQLIVIALALAALIYCVVQWPLPMFIALNGLMSLVYLVIVIFRFYIMFRGDLAAHGAIVATQTELDALGDPATLPVSVHMWGEDIARAGAERIDRLAGYREAGVSRVMGLVWASARTDDALESLAEDARAAGVELA